MKFDANSAIVKFWVNRIQTSNGTITVNDVPPLFNLKEVVASVIA